MLNGEWIPRSRLREFCSYHTSYDSSDSFWRWFVKSGARKVRFKQGRRKGATVYHAGDLKAYLGVRNG